MKFHRITTEKPRNYYRKITELLPKIRGITTEKPITELLPKNHVNYYRKTTELLPKNRNITTENPNLEESLRVFTTLEF